MSYRLLAITQAANDPATRYRLGQYISLLRDHHVETNAMVWPRERRDRDAVVEAARDFDGVVLFRRLPGARHAQRLRAAARRLSFDFDDCITRRDSSAGRPWPLWNKVLAFRRMMRLCDSVTAGNSVLADMAAKQVRGASVVVVPTTLDLSRYPKPVLPDAGLHPEKTVLGWIGQAATSQYLKWLGPPLARLCKHRPNLVVRSISSEPVVLRGVPTDFRQWSAATEVAELARFDIGLAPLTDDAWTRGKCGLRLLQYLAAGVPAVTSAVGVQREIGQLHAALLATTPEEWESAIERILTDADLAHELVATGRRLVESEFVPERWIAAIVESWCGMANPSMRKTA